MTSELETEVILNKELGEKHYNNYLNFYEQKNIVKSSEFLYGAVNAYFYAIGLTYDKKLGDHAKIYSFLPILVQDYDYEEVIDQFSAASTLHSNFFHNFLSEEDFELNKNKVIRLIENLINIIDNRLKKIKEIEK